MKDIKKYQGVIPAFYACYDAEGNISVEGVKALTRHLIAKGVKGVYVGGSSGECIYQHVDERKTVLEAVMSEAKGKLTVSAHVGCNNTADSMELARHAESVGVDAIASIPPIYFHLPEYAIAKYWNDMSAAAPNTEFVIYNIPQLAGTALTMSLLNEMLKNPNVVAVKNSSMPTQDIQMFKDAGIAARGEGNFVVFNGPDEQFVSGRVIGADGFYPVTALRWQLRSWPVPRPRWAHPRGSGRASGRARCPAPDRTSGAKSPFAPHTGCRGQSTSCR